MSNQYPKKSNSTELVSLADEDAVKEIIVNTVFGMWRIVNNLTRLRPTKHDRYRVTIFGSARAKPKSVAYEKVKKLSKSLSEMGCDIISGGGPGLMQAANEGASEAKVPERSRSVGIRVNLPFEQEVNPFVAEGYEHATFFSRLHHFVLASDAFVIVPGGIGTTLEALMVWQLLQVGHAKGTPLIFIGKMWADFHKWAKVQFLNKDLQLANPEDLDIPYFVDTTDEALEILKKYHTKWKKNLEVIPS